MLSEIDPYRAPDELPSSIGDWYGDYPERHYSGIRRRTYWVGILFIYLIGYLSVAGGSGRVRHPEMVLAGIGFWVVGGLAISQPRLRNLGYSSWWLLAFLVPFLNLVVFFRCLGAPTGYADHKSLDTTGYTVLVVYASWIAISVATSIFRVLITL